MFKWQNQTEDKLAKYLDENTLTPMLEMPPVRAECIMVINDFFFHLRNRLTHNLVDSRLLVSTNVKMY